MESRSIELCADDFGLDSGISSGILRLARLRRLSAVSCVVNKPDFVLYASELSSLKKQTKIGLHFNLTEGYFVSEPKKPCFPLNELLIKTHLHWIKRSFIVKELLAQLNHFIQTMQQLPDFIDGHQHVHQFPVIRQVVLEVYQQKFNGSRITLRSTWPSLSPCRFKASILRCTGGKKLHQQLCRLSIPHNDFFAGMYDFSPTTNYRDLFRTWLSRVQNNTLIMCHPREGPSDRDAIALARVKEMDYFLSDAFIADCEKYRVYLASTELFRSGIFEPACHGLPDHRYK